MKVHFYQNPLMQPRDGHTLSVSLTLTESQWGKLPADVASFLALSADIRPVNTSFKMGFSA